MHRRENFIVAGDRFAIGSSREMSQAGLKGIAEEAGLEMVGGGGSNMGDIFRRNSFNLGLHGVQSPEAVADAHDGDEVSFDPVTRQLRNETRAKTYEPVPLSPKEEEIRRSGGIFAVGRRDFATSVLTPPALDWPSPDAARRMSTTEQIMRASLDRTSRQTAPPGATLPAYADLLPASGGTTLPFTAFSGIAVGSRSIRVRPHRERPLRLHRRRGRRRQTAIGRVQRLPRHRAAYYALG